LSWIKDDVKEKVNFINVFFLPYCIRRLREGEKKGLFEGFKIGMNEVEISML